MINGGFALEIDFAVLRSRRDVQAQRTTDTSIPQRHTENRPLVISRVISFARWGSMDPTLHGVISKSDRTLQERRAMKATEALEPRNDGRFMAPAAVPRVHETQPSANEKDSWHQVETKFTQCWMLCLLWCL